MRSSAPIDLILYSPQTREGKQELARRAADVHAQFVFEAINKLDCPIQQKLELLQAVIDAVQRSASSGNRKKSSE